METFQIAELAERTGFSRPTLRYYERIGLLNAPERSEIGYRLYTTDDLARLEFIRRAKLLGLSLDEIRDLVSIWAGGECTTTRRHLADLVDGKIKEIRAQVEECATFLRQLELAKTHLDDTADDSADGCGCAPELPDVERVHYDREFAAITGQITHGDNDTQTQETPMSTTTESTSTCQCGCDTTVAAPETQAAPATGGCGCNSASTAPAEGSSATKDENCDCACSKDAGCTCGCSCCETGALAGA